MKRVLITGATGFVGANLARRLLADGHEVHALLRPEHNSWRIDSIRHELRLHILDLADSDAVKQVVNAIRPEWGFHLAVSGAYSWQTNVHEMVRTNITSTINLVDACLDAGCELFVNTGSSSEYGYKDHAPDETEAVEPNSSYAVTKVTATHYCRYLAQLRNARIIMLRLYSVYGPFEEPNRLMPTLITYGLRGELPPLVNPDIARDYIYVDDVIDAYLLAERGEPGAVYNVGTGRQTPLREAVATAREVIGISAQPEWGTMADRLWDTTIWLANNQRIKAALGWQPRHSFAEGFREMVDWLRSASDYHPRYGITSPGENP